MIRKEIYNLLLFGAALLLYAGCITDYTAKGIEEERDLLVVDGTITNGESTIILSNSVGLTEMFEGTEYIDNAKVWVETRDGILTDIVSSQGNGKYIIETGELKADTEYRLRISWNDEEYESEYLKPLFTPEIDSLFYTKAGEGEPVFMCVSTHDAQDQSKFYRWSYREVWEVHADLYANAKWTDDGGYEYLTPATNTYYCWGRDNSKTLILDSSEKLKENIIYRKRLIEIPTSHAKLSVLYYMEVKQMMMRKEAYDYFSNLQKNIESSSSIFAPVPSEMRGNIRCSTTPAMPIVGYIDVATTTVKDRYIPFNEGLYEPVTSSCPAEVTAELPSYFALAIYWIEPGSPPLYAPYRCVDCTLKEKASKVKPADWPNNHI